MLMKGSVWAVAAAPIAMATHMPISRHSRNMSRSHHPSASSCSLSARKFFCASESSGTVDASIASLLALLLGSLLHIFRALAEWKASMTSVASRPSYQSIQWAPAGWALRHLLRSYQTPWIRTSRVVRPTMADATSTSFSSDRRASSSSCRETASEVVGATDSTDRTDSMALGAFAWRTRPTLRGRWSTAHIGPAARVGPGMTNPPTATAAEDTIATVAKRRLSDFMALLLI
mmetsp:Transcript_6820/g.14192  ORF Transcript_6820/g.14192 Transcript_6820/m.14192 type:complete len:232 (+) Transcript_6820:149-844(+)